MYNLNGPTSWYGYHGFKQLTLQTSGINVSERVFMPKNNIFISNLTADFTFVHFNVLVWLELQLRR